MADEQGSWLESLKKYASIPRRLGEGMLGSLATLPQRAIENSQYALDTGNYDPGTSIETALTTMGATPFGAPRGAIGAGPVPKAPLDMAQEARMGRAQAQGYDTSTPLYHGTSKDAEFAKFKDSRHGTWTTRDPKEASQYAVENDSMGFSGPRFEPTNTASRVLPLYAKPLENPYVVAHVPDKVRNASNYKKAQSEWFDDLKRAGHDGVDYGNGIRVDFNNANLRSTAAPFNPANEGKSMILGSGATDRRLGAGLVATGQSGPIKAYHSSPHDFDKFDLSKIGTGEGAQVYGHGLYFAENPAVSGQGGQYWNQFLNRFEGYEGDAARALQRAGFDREAALKASQRDIDQLLTNYGDKLGVDPRYDVALERMRKEHALLSDKLPVGPRTYEVNINADPAHMLDWDKPLAQQSEPVSKALDQVLKSRDRMPGEWIKSSPGAEQRMLEVGIPGIKYLDQGSRGSLNLPVLEKQIAEQQEMVRFLEATSPSGPRTQLQQDKLAALEARLADALKPPSSNYVIFDPGRIDIMKKYGLAGLAPAGVAAKAAADIWEPPNPQ